MASPPVAPPSPPVETPVQAPEQTHVSAPFEPTPASKIQTPKMFTQSVATQGTQSAPVTLLPRTNVTSSKAPPSRTFAEVAPAPQSNVAPSESPTERYADAPAPKLPKADRDALLDSTEPTVRKTADKKAGKIPHNGFILELKVGTVGCTRAICSGSQRLSATPGIQLGGFMGGNIAGFVDIGFQGRWGMLSSSPDRGMNALQIYGIDPVGLQQQIQQATSLPMNMDLSGLNIESATSRVVNVGPSFRLHLIPRGRVSAYIGSGVSYQLFRSRYGTPTGPMRLDFHGLAIPAQAGLGAYVHKNIAVGAEFTYDWAYYMIVGFNHPAQRLVAPMAVVSEAARSAGADLRAELPHFWAITGNLRTRF